MNNKFNILYKQILYQCQQFKSLQKITKNNKINIFNNIISETIFKNEIFQKFFNQIQSKNQFQHYMKQDFQQIFPPNWKLLKKILKVKKRGQLFIFKIQYNYQSIKDSIIKLLNYLNSEFKENDLNNFIENIVKVVLRENSNAIFISLENITDFSIIFINKNHYSIKEIKHQFGYYYQWLTGENIYQSRKY